MKIRQLNPRASRRLLATVVVALSIIGLSCHMVHAADGDLDPTFGTGGKVVTDFTGNSNDELIKIGVQPDGKIIAVGLTIPSGGSGTRFALARYNPDGTLDSSFGDGGKVVTVFSPNTREVADDVLFLPDGKILVGGSFAGSNTLDSAFALLRYNSDGSLDSSFGNGGLVTTNIRSYFDSIGSLALQADGKIVAAGNSAIPRPPGEERNSDVALVRYHPDGSLDTTFGTNGIVISDFGPVPGYFADDATKVLIQPDGKIVIAGDSDGGSYYDFLIARYNSDGSLDSTFGNGGFTRTDVSGEDLEDGASDAVLQPDGKIVLAGWANRSFAANNDFALLRYNADGTLDSSFGTAGQMVFILNNLADEALSSVLLQPDGKILALGDSNSSSNSGFLVFRFNSDGAFDSTFGTSGVVRTPFASSVVTESLAFQNGKLIAAGFTPLYNTSDFALARYNIISAAVATVVSRQVHGASGAIFDLPLPLTGAPAIESRSGGATRDHELVFSFSRPITFGSVTVTPSNGGSALPKGQAAMSKDGQRVTVDLTNVSNAQTVTVTLRNVNDGTPLQDVAVRMSVLVGDTNGDGAVNAADATQTRSRSGSPADASNYRSDVNADGFINAADTLIVRSNSGASLP